MIAAIGNTRLQRSRASTRMNATMNSGIVGITPTVDTQARNPSNQAPKASPRRKTSRFERP